MGFLDLRFDKAAESPGAFDFSFFHEENRLSRFSLIFFDVKSCPAMHQQKTWDIYDDPCRVVHIYEARGVPLSHINHKVLVFV